MLFFPSLWGFFPSFFSVDPEKRLFSCVPACGRLFDGKKTLNHHRQNCGFVTEGGDDGEDKQPEDDEESEVELDDSNNGKQQDLPAAEDGAFELLLWI